MSSDLYALRCVSPGIHTLTGHIAMCFMELEPHELNRIALHNLLLTFELDEWQKFLAKPERLP